MIKLEDLAEVLVGQIMTRVTSKDGEGKSVSVILPAAIEQGILIDSSLGKQNLIKDVDPKYYTKKDDVVMKLTADYDATLINKEQEGFIISSLVCVIRSCKIDPGYLCAILNSDFIKNRLMSKAAGAIRPMLKVSDIRGLEIPIIETKDQEAIGEAYILSIKKTSVLQDMIANEKNIMKAVVNNAIMEEVNNE